MKIPNDLFIFDNRGYPEEDSVEVEYLFQYNGKILYSNNNQFIGNYCGNNESNQEVWLKCRKITKGEYIKYKLLGILDNYKEKG